MMIENFELYSSMGLVFLEIWQNNNVKFPTFQQVDFLYVSTLLHYPVAVFCFAPLSLL